MIQLGGAPGSPLTVIDGRVALIAAVRVGFQRKSDALVEVQRSTDLDPAFAS